MNMRYLPALFAISLALVPPVRGGLLDFFTRRPDMQVITVTDVTPEGKAWRPPTPESPVYYVAVSLGFKDLGGAVGGDKIPPKEEITQNITKVLAEQGYLPATDHSPAPTIALVFTWGTLNADYDYGFNPDLPPRQINRQQILKFLGGYKLGFSDQDFDPLTPPITGLSFKGYDASNLYDMTEEDFYMTIVIGYDLEALKKKQRKMLWITRISCPSRRYWLGEVMPTMLSVAAPNIGRETAKPVWVNASDRYKPSVKLGDMQLLEYLEKGKLPVIEKEKTPEPAKQEPAKIKESGP